MRTAVTPLATQLAKPLIALSALLFEGSSGAELHGQRLPAPPTPAVQPNIRFTPQDHGTVFIQGSKAQSIHRELQRKAGRNESVTPEDVVRLFDAFMAEPRSKPTGDFIRQYLGQFPDSAVAIKGIVRFLANTETITATYRTFGKYLSSDDVDVQFYTLMAFVKNNYGPERVVLSAEELKPLLSHADNNVSAAAFLMAHTRQLDIAPTSILQLIRGRPWLSSKDRQGGDEVRLGLLLNVMLDNAISPPDLASPLLRVLATIDKAYPRYLDTLAARPGALELFSKGVLREISECRKRALGRELLNENARALVTFHSDQTLFKEGDLKSFFESQRIQPTMMRYGANPSVATL